ncbi:hypothetical protein [Rubritalea tangerina]|uniref:Methyltransferase domain-containing protein n=1 Tax=Rubritalea tangerina TaxID=430798 RepID=A0ABW4Z628_9BACT
MNRIVEPEILDTLSPDDPAAMRSRADLRFVNVMMGGERWIVNEIAGFEDVECVIELGAGEGKLSSRIKEAYPQLEVLAMDLQGRPRGVHGGVKWKQGDVLGAGLAAGKETLVVTNMFLHHLDEGQLRKLDEMFSDVGGWICHEPVRSSSALFWGKLIRPLMGRVTRHDMIVSIKAGFVPGELGESLALQGSWHEEVGMFGSLRSKVVCE